jgi:hypothetical protein
LNRGESGDNAAREARNVPGELYRNPDQSKTAAVCLTRNNNRGSGGKQAFLKCRIL